jgi:hypothetical protein
MVTKGQLIAARRKVETAERNYEHAREARNVLVRAAVAEGNMRQNEVATAVGLTPTGVSTILRQRRRPTPTGTERTSGTS